MKVKLLKSRILIRRDNEDAKTKGGFFVPKKYREAKAQGTIVAVGPGDFDESGKQVPMELNIGDSVLFADHVGVEILVEGEDLLLMNESDVEAVYT
jgi:chaperonin GroES